jgi:hypothetical protein
MRWLFGLCDTLQPSQLDKGQTDTESDPSALLFGQLTTGVDSCYSDFKNTKLTVDYCIDWTVAGVNGKSEAERNRILEDARRVQMMIDKVQ